MIGLMKLIGAMLVIFAGTMIGFHQASRFVNRAVQIRQLIQALQRLETEIVYGFTPLPEALAKIGRQLSEPLAFLFQRTAETLAGQHGYSAAESWQQAVAECWNKTAMKAPEKDTVTRLGFSLGVSDREDQIKHLRLAMSELQAEEETARDEQRRYEKMWRSLGLLAGALVVIIMY